MNRKPGTEKRAAEKPFLPLKNERRERLHQERIRFRTKEPKERVFPDPQESPEPPYPDRNIRNLDRKLFRP